MTDTAKRSEDVQLPETATGADINPELKPGTAEALADIFRNLISHLGTLQESGEKANTSFHAYMDRIIILSGGTLTLTFTAVASLSSHLVVTHHGAKYIYFVVVACWLLVATIILGLRYIKCLINLRRQEGLQNTLTTTGAQMKLRLLMMPGVVSPASLAAIDAIPPLIDPKSLQVKINRLSRIVVLYGSLTEISLVSAFIFLALFIQANIVNMLSQ